MNNLNSIIVEGNIVRNGELAEPSEGFKVFKFSVAVNRVKKTRNNEASAEVSFFDIETYGKIAEYANQNCQKGRGVRVVGRLKQGRWKDAEGKTQSKIFIVAEHVEFKAKKLNNSEQKQNSEYETESAEEYPCDSEESEF